MEQNTHLAFTDSDKLINIKKCWTYTTKSSKWAKNDQNMTKMIIYFLN